MERKLGNFGFADFFANKMRLNSNFLDAVNELLNWPMLERKLHKKLGLSDHNCA
jgi:hypothetical protein